MGPGEQECRTQLGLHPLTFGASRAKGRGGTATGFEGKEVLGKGVKTDAAPGRGLGRETGLSLQREQETFGGL